jgi:hypothetical protein
MMGLLKGNGSHQKHNHTKDLQQPSLIIIAGMLFIVRGAFQRNVFEKFELCEFVLFIFAKLENSLHYGRESLHLCRIWGLASNCHLHIVMTLLHMTILECWVELVELRAKLLSIFWCC